MIDPEVKQQFDRLNDKLNKLLGETKKATWIKVSFVILLTGWDKEKLRQAREQGLIEWKKTEDGWLYKLESIPEQFIKKTA